MNNTLKNFVITSSWNYIDDFNSMIAFRDIENYPITTYSSPMAFRAFSAGQIFEIKTKWILVFLKNFLNLSFSKSRYFIF